jgi:hypothetical protein
MTPTVVDQCAAIRDVNAGIGLEPESRAADRVHPTQRRIWVLKEGIQRHFPLNRSSQGVVVEVTAGRNP